MCGRSSSAIPTPLSLISILTFASALLAVMVILRHPNLILTKDQIISHVWNYEANILPNTVEVYIGYLRNKVDKPFRSEPLIHTIRGFGYKIGN